LNTVPVCQEASKSTSWETDQDGRLLRG